MSSRQQAQEDRDDQSSVVYSEFSSEVDVRASSCSASLSELSLATGVEQIPKHRFSDFLEKKLRENLLFAQEPIGALWQKVHEDGSMNVFRRDADEKGTVCDQLKATHSIQGVTAKELLAYYYNTDVRVDWENTIESLRILEHLGPDTCVVYNIHKTVWPTSSRDSCVLSHRRQISEGKHTVMNISVDHPQVANTKHVRIQANVLMVASTVVNKRGSGKAARSDVSCDLTYLAYVNPGGWAPSSLIQAVSKREYPKFLRALTTAVVKHYESRPLDF